MSNFNLLDMTASGGEGAEWVAAEGFAVVVVARSLAGVDHRFPFVRPPAASFSSLERTSPERRSAAASDRGCSSCTLGNI